LGGGGGVKSLWQRARDGCDHVDLDRSSSELHLQIAEGLVTAKRRVQRHKKLRLVEPSNVASDGNGELDERREDADHSLTASGGRERREMGTR
jgi:hypothetical protein